MEHKTQSRCISVEVCTSLSYLECKCAAKGSRGICTGCCGQFSYIVPVRCIVFILLQHIDRLALVPLHVECLAVERESAGGDSVASGFRGLDGHGVRFRLRGVHGLLNDVVITGTGDKGSSCNEQGGQS